MTAARLAGLPPEAERALQARFDRLERQISALTTTPNQPGLIESDYTAQEGQTLFFAAPATGKKLLLPAPRGLNRSACIGLVFTTTGPVTISCAGGTVNGAATLINRVVGSYWAVCDGSRGWFIAPIIDDGASLTLSAGVLNYTGSTSNVNSSTTAGDLNVFNISALECGGVVSLQGLTEANIDGFTAKTDGFWFVLNVRDATTSDSVSLIENSGNTTTSIRTPDIRDWRLTKNDSVMLIYSNSRWRVVASYPKPFFTPSESVTWAAQQDNFTRTSRGIENIRVTLTGPQNLTGVVPDGVTPNGELLLIENIDTVDTLTIPHDVTSTAGNRFFCPLALAHAQPPLTSSLWRYDATSSRWRMMSHS